MKFISLTMFILVFSFVLLGGVRFLPVYAQESLEAIEENPQSVLFTYWEYEAIQEARNARGMARAPTESELMRELESGMSDGEEKVKPPPEEREVTLGGIVFSSAQDWTVWLNGERVTPKALPEEIIDIRVYNQHIDIKWFDEYTNKIFPIRLRPHQRFNLDTRIFLAG